MLILESRRRLTICAGRSASAGPGESCPTADGANAARQDRIDDEVLRRAGRRADLPRTVGGFGTQIGTHRRKTREATRRKLLKTSDADGARTRNHWIDSPKIGSGWVTDGIIAPILLSFF